jgi:hypothetical protein
MEEIMWLSIKVQQRGNSDKEVTYSYGKTISSYKQQLKDKLTRQSRTNWPVDLKNLDN